MATPTKLALIVNKIPLEPVDYDKFGLSIRNRKFLTPVRFRKTLMKPRGLPKIVTNGRFMVPHKELSQVLTAFSASKGVVKLENLLKSKLKIGIVHNRNYGYIKNSTRKRMEETFRSRSKQESPIPLDYNQMVEILKDKAPRMVDATFNTDYWDT